jgi:hypothetical protein
MSPKKLPMDMMRESRGRLIQDTQLIDDMFITASTSQVLSTDHYQFLLVVDEMSKIAHHMENQVTGIIQIGFTPSKFVPEEYHFLARQC